MKEQDSAQKSLKELVELFRSFNEATKKLQFSNILLQKKVEELEERSKELEKKERLTMLGEMAAAIAHEFRNPLGGIEIYAQLLKRDLAGDSQKVQIIDKILSAVGTLNNLIVNILNFAGKINLQKKPSDVHRLIDSVFDEVFASKNVQNVSVVKNYEFRENIVNLDPTLFQRVCENIIVNAIEAMPEGGSIKVSTEKFDLNGVNYFKLKISDSGVGLSKKAMENIFTPFYTEKHRGIGLGLATSARVIEAHNGRIEAKNNSEGGACFEIFLPL